MRNVTGVVTASLCVALSAGAARADFFSFASDRNREAPTFRTFANDNVLRDARSLDPTQRIEVDLLWDADENGPGGPVTFETFLTFNGSLSGYQVTPLAGGFLHTYTLGGLFSFADRATQQTLLSVNFRSSLFASFSDRADALGETATIQASGSTDVTLLFTGAGPLDGRNFSGTRNFAFTLTDLSDLATGGRAGVNGAGISPNGWTAEGSFSARAIPSPGSLALAGLGALVAARRRRA